MRLRKRKKKINKEKQPISYEIGGLDIEFLKMEIIRKSISKIVVLLLIIILNWNGLLAVGRTFAYFNDTEESPENTFSAGILDFSLTNANVEKLIGIELGEDIEFSSVLTKISGSLGIQYKVYAEKMSGSDDDFCQALRLKAFHSTISYDGDLLSFETATTTALGTWAFEIRLPQTATNIANREKCNVDLVFKGWRDDVTDFDKSGFTDEERIHLNLTSRMVVLNEFLPNPEGKAYGFDFGDDSSSMPQGEWVELYNNSDTGYSLNGWYIWDASGDNSNKVFISNLNTYPATTNIDGKSWLVVYMNKEILDNSGDTVKLFDNNDVLVDWHTYTVDSDYCDIEPTPGDLNTTSGSGNCPGVPANKSYARIPDGIGGWVDPFPTPGGPNVLTESEEVLPNNRVNEPSINKADVPGDSGKSLEDTSEVQGATTTEVDATTTIQAGTTTEETTAITTQTGTTTEETLDLTNGTGTTTEESASPIAGQMVSLDEAMIVPEEEASSTDSEAIIEASSTAETTPADVSAEDEKDPITEEMVSNESSVGDSIVKEEPVPVPEEGNKTETPPSNNSDREGDNGD